MSKNIRWDDEQKEILLDYMNTNPDFAAGRLLGPLGKQKEAELWLALTNLLNSRGVGAHKTTEKWIRTWSDWKANTRAKASEIRNFSIRTGGGLKCPKKLSDLELRLLEFIGWTTVTGLTHIAEAGIAETDTKPTVQPAPVGLVQNENPGCSGEDSIGLWAVGVGLSAESEEVGLHRGLQEVISIACDVVRPSDAAGSTVLYENQHVCGQLQLTPEPQGSSKRKRGADKTKNPTPRNPNEYSAAAQTFRGKEENRTKYYEHISTSLKDISDSMKEVASAETRKAAALERIAKAKELKYGNRNE